MSPGQLKPIRAKRKYDRKKSQQIETSSSLMVDKQCEKQLTSQESDDDGQTIAKRIKCGNDDQATVTAGWTETKELSVGKDAGVTTPCAEQDTLDEGTLQPTEGSDTIQSQLASAASDKRQFDSKFWLTEYQKLEEVYDQYRNETRQEIASLKEQKLGTEYEVDCLRWEKIHRRKDRYSRDLGYLTPPGLSWHPEYSLIAGEGSHPWLEQILKEGYCEESGVPLCFWVAERLITRYVLRIFEPMLAGLDKEVESLLLRVRGNMELRMVPAMANKWMGETLRSYTLLPKYDQEREDYLRSHTRHLENFMERFFPIAEAIRYPGLQLSAEISRKKIFERIIEPAANLAAQMSFSYQRFEVDWDYCAKTTEIFYKDLDNHDVFGLNGQKLHTRNFPGFEEEEKIGVVVLFVRPPIFAIGSTGFRRIFGSPRVIVRPTKSVDGKQEVE